jgi:RNA polymerase sigma-70 factor, ECF subfamily
VSVETDQEEFFHAQFPRLAGFCASGVGDRALGADLASEALLRVLARWRRLDNPAAFAYRVAANLIVDELRRRGTRRRTVQQLARTSEQHVAAPDLAVRDLAERLPRKLREPVLLHYYADLAVDEVAQLLGRPPGTVRRQLSEARRLLRTDLVEQP